MSIKQINGFEDKQSQLVAEVLPDRELQKMRFQNLQKAMKLWNVLHEKSRIKFRSGEEIKTVDTPVWFVSEKYVCINAGITIMVSCILEVIF